MIKKWFIGLAVVIFLSLLFLGIVYQKSEKKDHQNTVALREKYVGTHFPLEGITDLEGKPVSRKIFSAKEYTVVDFWFLGCSPCIKEMKNFSRYLQDNPNLQIVSVNIDELATLKRLLVGDRKELAKTHTGETFQEEVYDRKNNFSGLAFLAEGHDNWYHLNKRNTREALEIGHGLDIDRYPTYFLVNSEGLILDRLETFDEYFYSSFQKAVRDKAGFFYFLSTNHELVKAFFFPVFLVYLVGSLLFLGVRKLVKSQHQI